MLYSFKRSGIGKIVHFFLANQSITIILKWSFICEMGMSIPNALSEFKYFDCLFTSHEVWSSSISSGWNLVKLFVTLETKSYCTTYFSFVQQIYCNNLSKNWQIATIIISLWSWQIDWLKFAHMLLCCNVLLIANWL